MNKKAFSLAEILIALSIVSVLSLMTVIVMKPSDKVMKQFYVSAYSMLRNASNTSFEEYTNNQNVTDTGDARNFLNAGGRSDGQTFCEGLLRHINTGKKDIDCATYDISDSNKINDVLRERPSFTALNQARFWVSNSSLTLNDPHHNYIIVLVDLNGEQQRPNAFGYNAPNRGNMSDVVAFAVLDDGEVVPLGAHASDTRYITAEVITEDSAGNRSSLTLTDYCTARGLAWGKAIKARDALSLADDINTKFFGSTEARSICNRQSGNRDNNCRAPRSCFIDLR